MDEKDIHIKREIDDTRSAMGDKIDMIANRIHNTIIGPKVAADNLIENLREYKKVIEETPSATGNGDHPVHQAVAETIDRLKATINVIEQLKRDPWIMFASAVLMGYVIGNINRGDVWALCRPRPQVYDRRELQRPTSTALP